MKTNIIFDTDMGKDVDDALAQVLLHSLVQEGAAEFGVALVNKGTQLAPAFTDLINRFINNILLGLKRFPADTWATQRSHRVLSGRLSGVTFPLP